MGERSRGRVPDGAAAPDRARQHSTMGAMLSYLKSITSGGGVADAAAPPVAQPSAPPHMDLRTAEGRARLAEEVFADALVGFATDVDYPYANDETKTEVFVGSLFDQSRVNVMRGERSARTYLGRLFHTDVLDAVYEYVSLRVDPRAFSVHVAVYGEGDSVHSVVEIAALDGGPSVYVDALYRNIAMVFSGWSTKWDSPYTRFLFEHNPPVLVATADELAEFHMRLARARAADPMHAGDKAPLLLSAQIALGRARPRRRAERRGRHEPDWLAGFRRHVARALGARGPPTHDRPHDANRCLLTEPYHTPLR